MIFNGNDSAIEVQLSMILLIFQWSLKKCRTHSAYHDCSINFTYWVSAVCPVDSWCLKLGSYILQHVSTLSVNMRSTNQACLHSVFDQICTSETGERIRMTVVEADSKCWGKAAQNDLSLANNFQARLK